MKISAHYVRKDPDTVMGHKVVVTTVYSSFDIREIDIIEDSLRAQYGGGVVSEVDMAEIIYQTYGKEDNRNDKRF